MKTLLKIGVGGLVGIGLGLFVGEYKREQLEMERDALELSNKCLTAKCEILQKYGDNMRANNELYKNLLLQQEDEEA